MTRPSSTGTLVFTIVLGQPSWGVVTVVGLAAVVVVAVLVVAVRDRVAAWRHARWAREARWVTIAAPPQLEAGSAVELWRTLTGVLTPAIWRRWVYGTPHVAWE
ncbi:MAG TPA: hypothetical protein VI248_05295 [Kineosporiaceae bacterium]